MMVRPCCIIPNSVHGDAVMASAVFAIFDVVLDSICDGRLATDGRQPGSLARRRAFASYKNRFSTIVYSAINA